MNAGPAVLIVLACAAVAATIGWLWHVRRERYLRRRLSELTATVDPALARPTAITSESLQQLERAVAALRADHVALDRRLALALGALADLPVHNVVIDPSRRQAHRGGPPPSPGFDHTHPIVESTIDDLLTEALDGVRARRVLRLSGPPARRLVVTADPVLDDGEILGAVAAVVDETDSDLAAAMRRDFVANLSHELKTPVGALALLTETLVDETDEEVRNRLLDRVSTESQRMARIVDELLELAELEHAIELTMEPVPVASVLSEAVDAARPAADRRHTKIIVTDPSDLEVLGERRLLVRAVTNLLENAVKYSDPESEVRVGAHLDTTGDGGDRVAIDVADDGIGIPSRDLGRIFERFYRVDRARSRASGGTGLGLSIVRHTAERHGGEVRVESHEGEGSTFTVLLPPAPPGGSPR